MTDKETIELLSKRLMADDSDSTVGACNCLTKSPDIQYHKKGCKYRLIVERDEARRLAGITAPSRRNES